MAGSPGAKERWHAGDVPPDGLGRTASGEKVKLSDYHGQYGVKAIPHMLILGRDGRIAAIHVGYGEGEIPILVGEINALLTKPAHPAE